VPQQYVPGPADTARFPGYPAQNQDYPPPGYAQPGYPGQPGYPPPDYSGTPYAPPVKKKRTGLIIGIVAGVLVLCVLGSVGGGLLIGRSLNAASAAASNAPTIPTDDPLPTAGTTTPTDRRTSTAAVPSYTGDLRTLLVARPTGAQPWKDFADADGKLTLAETTDLFEDPTAVEKELTSLKYQRGAVMHWSKSDVFVLIFLFQFDTAKNAAGYVTRQETNGIEGYVAKGEFASIAESLLLLDDTPDSDGDRSTISLTSRGTIVSYVTVWFPGAIDQKFATDLGQQQHKRLP
jgi:hypothetical protein